MNENHFHFFAYS